MARRLTLAFGEEIDIGILEQGWGLAALELDVMKRGNTNYDPT